MKFKKLLSSGVATSLLAACITTTAFATNYKHGDDEWIYGQAPSFRTCQVSNFYCSKQYHHATAVVVTPDGQRHEDKGYANAGKWAKAETDCFWKVSEWNSYYGHD